MKMPHENLKRGLASSTVADITESTKLLRLLKLSTDVSLTFPAMTLKTHLCGAYKEACPTLTELTQKYCNIHVTQEETSLAESDMFSVCVRHRHSYCSPPLLALCFYENKI